MGQHLGFLKNQNSLRRWLIKDGVEPESCGMFDLIAYGPIFPEIGKRNGLNRDELMLLHIPVRDQIAGLEKKLRDALVAAGHKVLNLVNSNKPYDTAQWNAVRLAFADHFPSLRRLDP
jgi:hypothetical protein